MIVRTLRIWLAIAAVVAATSEPSTTRACSCASRSLAEAVSLDPTILELTVVGVEAIADDDVTFPVQHLRMRVERVVHDSSRDRAVGSIVDVAFIPCNSRPFGQADLGWRMIWFVARENQDGAELRLEACTYRVPATRRERRRITRALRGATGPVP